MSTFEPKPGDLVMVDWGPGDERRARFVRLNRNGRAIVNMQSTVANAQPRRYKDGFGANRTVEAADLNGPAPAWPETSGTETEAASEPAPAAPTAAPVESPKPKEKKAKGVRPIVDAREAANALKALGVHPAMPTMMGSVVLAASAALEFANKLKDLADTEANLVDAQKDVESLEEELTEKEDKVRELEDANETLADELKTCKAAGAKA